jgi:DegV family protein with EDD domain
MGVLGSLDHLQRGGRIGGAAALVGSLLSIKPVIQVKDGVVEQESRQRTRARALDYLVAKCRADAPLERIAVADGAADDIDAVASRLREIETAHPLLVVDLGPVVGTHAGPGTVGLCYQVAAGA